GIRGAAWFLGVSEWLFGALLLLGFWNKKAGILGAPRWMRLIRVDHNYHSVHAGWLGSVRRWISSNDGAGGIPDEGPGSACCLFLSAETGPGERVSPVKEGRPSCHRTERDARYHAHAKTDGVKL